MLQGVFPLTVALVRVRSPPDCWIPPLPDWAVDVLAVTVELDSVKGPYARMPPPEPVFPLTVDLFSVTGLGIGDCGVRDAMRIPPTPLTMWDVFQEIVLSLSSSMTPPAKTNLEDIERLLRDRLDAIGPTSRAVLQHILTLPDHERARRIGDLFSDPRTQTFAQLLIDLEESPYSRAVALGMLREEELRCDAE